MKKILALATLALALVVSHACQAAEISAPTQPPPFIPDAPRTAAPADLDKLMHLFDDAEEKEVAKPKLKCEKHPCVFGYRFSDSVTEESAGQFAAFMGAAVEAGADTVMVELNTPGGSLDQGHEISRVIEHAPLTVACVVDGKAASMGMYILQSCDVRVMTKRSYLMVHQVSFMVRGGARITQAEIDKLRVQIDVSTRGYIEWVAHRMKISVAEVLAKVANGGEWFITWEEALKVGAVDKVISDPPEAYFQQLKAVGAGPRRETARPSAPRVR